MTQVNVNLTNNKISYHVNTTVPRGNDQCLCLQVIYSYTVRDIFHLRKKAKVKKNKKEVIQEPDFFSYLPGSHSGSNFFFFNLFNFGFLEKTLHESCKILVEHALVLLGYSFEPRLISRAYGTEGSDTAIGLSKTECSHSEKTVSNFKGLKRFSESRLFSFSSFRNMQKRRPWVVGEGGGGGRVVGRGSSR